MTENTQASHETEIAIIGAGILGLTNALQYARRGFNVTLIDNIVQQKRSFKVGESLLIFSNPFLRTIGDIDDFVHNSFPKDGVWFTYGMEGQTDFENRTEWAFQSKIPKDWQDNIENQKLFRAMFYDAQIVRPEAEDLMREHVRAMKNIRFLDTAKVREFDLAEDDASLHTVGWECGVTKERGTVKARWILDCSGRNRLLAKSLKHASEVREMNDGFQTTAVWAQFDHIEDDLFGPEWTYHFNDGVKTIRDRCTTHLWGDGYWIWVIRLSEKRISIGVTWDQRRAPPGKTQKDQFWDVINRYPLLTKALKEEHILEFRSYKNVQYMTDTFVSAKRYGMVGDAASIIDAYYSQGVSLALITSWHIANIVQEDMRAGKLDTEYIDQVNRATRQDWHMMRNTVTDKFSPAIADPRFFIMSHFLDFVMFSCALAPRWQLVRWLVETESDPNKENEWHKSVRKRLRKSLYYSQTPPFGGIKPETVQRFQKRLQNGLGERARWRLENGVKLGEVKAIARAYSMMPNVLSLPFARKSKVMDISPPAIKMPKSMMFTGREDTPLPFRFGGPTMLSMFMMMYGYDAAETGVRKLWHRMTGKKPVEKPLAEVKPIHPGPTGEALGNGDVMPDLTLATDTGETRKLSDYWKEKPTAFVFIRHFGCPHCRAELTRLKKERTDIERLGGQIVVVSMGTVEKAAEFKKALGLDFPFLADPNEMAYAACGLHLTENKLSKNLKAVTEDAPVALSMMAKGQYGKFVFGGNEYRLGGTFVADKEGRLAYLFRSHRTMQTAPIEDVLQAFRAIAGFGTPKTTNGEAPGIGKKQTVMG